MWKMGAAAGRLCAAMTMGAAMSMAGCSSGEASDEDEMGGTGGASPTEETGEGGASQSDDESGECECPPDDSDEVEPVDPCAAIIEQQTFCNTLGDSLVTTMSTLEPGCHVYGELDLAATMTVKTDPEAGPTIIVADLLTVRMGGELNASGAGHPADAGPGAGGISVPWGSGAGHGGKGGDKGEAVGGSAYGDPKYPVEAGSGGGNGGGAGGGALLICARQSATIDGDIRANGAGAGATGGGSGGSILLISPRVQGAGSLEARGGLASATILCAGNGGSGAGGRIAVYADEDQFTSVGSGTGTLDVGGGGGCSPGAGGSQFVSTLSELP